MNIVDLLDKMLVLDPKKRYSVNECLNHPFFKTSPLPATQEE